MFSGVLTGTSTSSRLVHGLLLIDKLKTLSIFANSFSATPIPSRRIKGFTGLMSISYNRIRGVHGFTGPAPCSPPPISASSSASASSSDGRSLPVQSSMFDVRRSMFRSRPSTLGPRRSTLIVPSAGSTLAPQVSISAFFRPLVTPVTLCYG